MTMKLKKKKKHRNHPALTDPTVKNTYFKALLQSGQTDLTVTALIVFCAV